VCEIEVVTQFAQNMTAAISQFGLVEVFPILKHRVLPLGCSWKRMSDTFFHLEDNFFQENMRYAQSSTSYNWARQIFDMKEAQDIPLTTYLESSWKPELRPQLVFLDFSQWRASVAG
jgi:hypothetical protein